LRHCTTSLKVAGSIPDDVIETILPAVGPTQPLNRHAYQEYLLAGKGGYCVGSLNILEPSGLGVKSLSTP
jgi:hypothetical protein